MRRSCKVWLSLSVTLSLAGLIQPMLVAKPGEKSKVTICVYDHSGLKAGTLAQAEKEADGSSARQESRPNGGIFPLPKQKPLERQTFLST